MKRFAIYGLLGLCGLGILAGACIRVQAQQIGPVIQEFNKKVRGAIQLTNSSDAPKFVSCQAQGFDPDERGASHPHPLDPALNVRITAERMELAPRETRQISFDATPAVLPAWFLLTCRFVPVERGPGMTLAMVLSSVVIVHGGQLDSRDVSLSAKHVGTEVEIEVQNNGSGLARVDSVEVLGHRERADLKSFILYPHQKRIEDADWKVATPPVTARIHIGKNRLEAPVD